MPQRWRTHRQRKPTQKEISIYGAHDYGARRCAPPDGSLWSQVDLRDPDQEDEAYVRRILVDGTQQTQDRGCGRGTPGRWARMIEDGQMVRVPNPYSRHGCQRTIRRMVRRTSRPLLYVVIVLGRHHWRIETHLFALLCRLCLPPLVAANASKRSLVASSVGRFSLSASSVAVSVGRGILCLWAMCAEKKGRAFAWQRQTHRRGSMSEEKREKKRDRLFDKRLTARGRSRLAFFYFSFVASTFKSGRFVRVCCGRPPTRGPPEKESVAPCEKNKERQGDGIAARLRVFFRNNRHRAQQGHGIRVE